MAERYLPTFSARPIELNIHRIPDLAERFVYFNDDMFIINKIRPEYFFQHDLPTDMGIRNFIIGNDYSTVLYNALRIVEKNLGLIKSDTDSILNVLNLNYITAISRYLYI